MAQKFRLDKLISQLYPQFSKTQIQNWIIGNRVKVGGKVVNKPGLNFAQSSLIELDIQEQKFVCRAGFKLEKALEHFNIDIKDLTVLDAGLSTGGFTDCLLQFGAKKVYGVDVGHGQVHEKIKSNPQVVVLEKTNLRYLDNLPELVDLATLDLSFISLLKVIEPVKKLLKPNGKLITLIKPQFEAGKDQISKSGVITDSQVHEQVIKSVTSQIVSLGFQLIGVIESPITGTSGNKEFLAYFANGVLNEK